MKTDYEGLTHQSIDKILNHFFQGEKDFVQEYTPANILEKSEQLLFSNEGISNKKALDLIDFIIKNSPDTQHPGFGGRLYAGILPPAFIGQVLSSALNNSLGTYQASQVGAIIERKLLEIIGEKLGLTDVDGIMTPGGLAANREALHLARLNAFPEIKEKGMTGKSFHVYVSDEAHYSFIKSASFLGIGTNSVIKIKTDGLGRMCIDDLERKIILSCDEDVTPLMIVSTAGTTVLGAFDPIAYIDLVAKKYKIWHHVDLIWGLGVVFTDRNKYITGIESVESVAVNFHKTLGTGISSSMILVNGMSDLLTTANAIGGAAYLNYSTGDDDYYATGNKSQQCGRPNDALKVFFTFKILGFDGYKELINTYFDQAAYFAKKVNKNKYLLLLMYNKHQPYLNVCVQVCDSLGIPSNGLTEQIHEYFSKDYSIWVVEKPTWKGKTILRFVFNNHNLTIDYINKFFDELDKKILELHNKKEN